MTELFNELAVVGDEIQEEDRVVYLLASLPESFNTLVTALEAHEDVPKMEIVTERLLHAERKRKETAGVIEFSEERALATKRRFDHQYRRGPQCHYCKKFGHIQKNCMERIKSEGKDKQGGAETQRGKKPKSNKIGLVTRHVLGVKEPAQNWVVDSGATCHISNTKELFEKFRPLSKPQKVTLGDGHILEAVGTGVVELKLKLPGGQSKIGRLDEVLYVPTLAYNLLSVPKVTEAGKTVKFGETQGELIGSQGEIVGIASKAGNLYYLNCM